MNCNEAAREGHTAHLLECFIYVVGGTSPYATNDSDIYVFNGGNFIYIYITFYI